MSLAQSGNKRKLEKKMRIRSNDPPFKGIVPYGFLPEEYREILNNCKALPSTNNAECLEKSFETMQICEYIYDSTKSNSGQGKNKIEDEILSFLHKLYTNAMWCAIQCAKTANHAGLNRFWKILNHEISISLGCDTECKSRKCVLQSMLTKAIEIIFARMSEIQNQSLQLEGNLLYIDHRVKYVLHYIVLNTIATLISSKFDIGRNLVWAYPFVVYPMEYNKWSDVVSTQMEKNYSDHMHLFEKMKRLFDPADKELLTDMLVKFNVRVLIQAGVNLHTNTLAPNNLNLHEMSMRNIKDARSYQFANSTPKKQRRE